MKKTLNSKLHDLRTIIEAQALEIKSIKELVEPMHDLLAVSAELSFEISLSVKQINSNAILMNDAVNTLTAGINSLQSVASKLLDYNSKILEGTISLKESHLKYQKTITPITEKLKGKIPQK